MTHLDLSKIAPPPVIKPVNYQEILERGIKAYAIDETLAAQAHSEPVLWVLRAMAAEVLRIYQRINESAQAVMLPTAIGKDLDVLAQNFGVERLILQKANKELGISADILESDNNFRARVQLALEGLTTAGPISAYQFHASGVSIERNNIVESVKDVSVISPEPGVVAVAVLSSVAPGEASKELVQAVFNKLNQHDIRPLTDKVEVSSAEIVIYNVQARLELDKGPESTVAIAKAKEILTKYTKEQHRLGRNISVSGLYAALHQPGVNNVSKLNIKQDIIINDHQAAFCENICVE